MSTKFNKPEKTIHSNLCYQGKFISVHQDSIELADGVQATREYVVFPKSVAILAITSDNKLILERQYRHTLQDWILEIPAGKVDASEDILLAAKRELLEETGYSTDQWQKLWDYYTSPGVLTENQTMFLAKNCIYSVPNLDVGEHIEVVLYSKTELFEMMQKKQIHDGKTILAVYFYLNSAKFAS